MREEDLCIHYGLKTKLELEMEREVYEHNKRLSFKTKVKGFIITGVSTFVISLIGLIAFAVADFYIIHPSIYIMGTFIGLGWLLTGMSIIKRMQKRGLK